MVPRSCWHSLAVAASIISAVVFTGCTARHYRKSADKEVYSIIQQAEQQVLGHTNSFTIDTRYSARDPKSILAPELIQERTSSNRLVLNLEQVLNMAVQNSREYQTEKERLYLTALTLTGARYQFTPHFFAETTPQLAGNADGQMAGSVGSRVGVSQLLKTGGSLSVSLANDLVRYFTGKPDFAARNSAIDTLSVDIAQPLLRGFGINDPTVEQLTQAERNTVYAVRDFSFFQEQFAVEIVNAYFTLLTQKDKVRDLYHNYTNRVETTRYLEARAVDRERRASVDQARSAELGARASYINQLAQYLSSLDSLKLRMGVPLSQDLYLDDSDLRDLIAAGLVPVEIDRNAAFAICLTNQTEILTAIDQFEDSKRKLRIAADQLRADVNFFATARLQSDEPDDYANFKADQIRYTTGLRLNLPIDRLRERNTYRSTIVSFESQLRALTLTLDSYKDRIDRGLRTIEQARLNFLNGMESLKVAQNRVDNETMLLEAGRNTIRDLRESQDQLIQAQLELSDLYAGYLAARLGLLLNMGVLESEKPKFWLNDPLKGKLNPEQMSTPPLRMPEDQVVPPESFLEPAT